MIAQKYYLHVKVVFENVQVHTFGMKILSVNALRYILGESSFKRNIHYITCARYNSGSETVSWDKIPVERFLLTKPLEDKNPSGQHPLQPC